MPSITARDAFGYHSTNGLGNQLVAQTKQYVSTRVRSETLKSVALPLPQWITNIVVTKMDVTKKVIDDQLKNQRLSIRRLTFLSNLIKALSYLPIIGTIIGIVGLVLLNKYEKRLLELTQ